MIFLFVYKYQYKIASYTSLFPLCQKFLLWKVSDETLQLWFRNSVLFLVNKQISTFYSWTKTRGKYTIQRDQKLAFLRLIFAINNKSLFLYYFHNTIFCEIELSMNFGVIQKNWTFQKFAYSVKRLFRIVKAKMGFKQSIFVSRKLEITQFWYSFPL